jgi:hypothetical protein
MGAASQSFSPRTAKKHFDRFSRRHVRREKHISAFQCASEASARRRLQPF